MKNNITHRVIEMLQQRHEKGLKEYGETLDDAKYSTHEWLVHLQEELLDAACYVEKLKTIQSLRDKLEEGEKSGFAVEDSAGGGIPPNPHPLINDGTKVTIVRCDKPSIIWGVGCDYEYRYNDSWEEWGITDGGAFLSVDDMRKRGISIIPTPTVKLQPVSKQDAWDKLHEIESKIESGDASEDIDHYIKNSKSFRDGNGY
jgi:hypothetical protein